MNDLFIDNLAILAFYVIGFISLLCTAGVIAELIMEWQEGTLQVKYCKFTTTMRNILAKLWFN